MADTATEVGGLVLANPVIAASGTFGFGFEFASLYDLSKVGAIVLKSLTVSKRAGNPPPRIFETPSGMINSIGLENPGLDAFLSEVLPRLSCIPTRKIASIAGESQADFAALAEALGLRPEIDAFEVNVSCPNQAAGGMAFGTDPSATAAVVRIVRGRTDKPVIAKLTPVAADIASVAAAAQAAGADAVTVANTYPALSVDWRKTRPRIHGIRGRGGLSGPAIKPLTLRLVAEVSARVSISVVASGGIMDADDAMEFVVAGASAVQVGTANFVDPLACARIAEGIAGLLDSTDRPRLADWVGKLEC